MKIDKVEEVRIELPIDFNEWKNKYKYDERLLRDLFDEVYEGSAYEKNYGGLKLEVTRIGSSTKFEMVMKYAMSGNMDYSHHMELIERVFNDFCELQRQYLLFLKLQRIHMDSISRVKK